MANQDNKIINMPVKETEKKEVEIQDYLYRFEEMVDGMDASLRNLKEVIEQQEELVKVVENSNKAEYFEEFIKDTKEQTENLKNQFAKLNFKKSVLEQVIERCKNDVEHSKTISMLSTALSIFDN